jgi:hypothetical protein
MICIQHPIMELLVAQEVQVKVKEEEDLNYHNSSVKQCINRIL